MVCVVYSDEYFNEVTLLFHKDMFKIGERKMSQDGKN